MSTAPDGEQAREIGGGEVGRVRGMAGGRPRVDASTRDARTVAVVVSDIVGSTALRTAIGEAAFTSLREAHDAFATNLVEACGGRVVRFTGDGLLVEFASAGQALEYSAMLSPAVGGLGDGPARLAVRVGIALGDTIDVDGDLDGPALVEASRLCDAAEPGQVLCTESVRRASRSDERDFGHPVVVTLKGLGAVEVREFVRRVTDHAPAGLTVSVLGQLRAARAGRPLDLGGTKEQRVLAVLAAARGGLVLVDELIEALWGNAPPRTAERSVHAYVARLRKALEPSRRRGAPPRVIITEGKGYRLPDDETALDSVRFERLTRTARDERAAGHALRARQALDEAIQLWRGTPFHEHLDAERCAREARRLEEVRELAIEDHTSVRLELGAAADLVPDLEALVTQHPLREQLWSNLMLALYRAGRQAEALRTFQRARATLVEELGIEPGPELHHLESRILAQDPSLLSAAPGVTGPIRRLPDALDYGGSRLLGRDEELALLHAAWERAFAGTGEFVAVIGREGIGKTRLVSELATHASDAGAVVLYSRCDAADQRPEAPLDRALRSAGAQLSDVIVEGDETTGAALVRFLSLWSGGRPVLLLLDDFQLADTATVEALADLAEWSASAALLVVAMFRPEDGDEGASGSGRIALAPLPRAWVLEIARGYRSRWTERDIDELVAVSGGVPRAVHQYASEWAHEATRREVHAAAERTSEARVRLVASRGELADGIEGLQRLIEHRQTEMAPGTDAGRRARPPYRGLEAFGSDDSDLFFGREQLVGELVARVASAPLVVVVGASGSGKSSVIRAGLLPALETGVVWDAGTWSSTVVVPGSDPRAVLDALEGDPGAQDHRLVVIDQLEELWTACTDPGAHDEFCDHLVALSRDERVTPVLCIRADFVDRIADHAPLAALVGANTLLVPPMTSDELHRVVEGPAQRTGLRAEPQLVETIVADVHGRPGALPLLSTALLATWERREARTLTLAGYRAAGGVASAVAAMGDACYDALAPAAQRAARRILLQLAGEEHGVDVRRRVPIVAIGADDPDTRRALDALVARRLVILDGDVAEVAHEALLRDWPRLAAWLDEDRIGRQLRQRLGAASTTWVESDRDESELYRGARLDAATEWAAAHIDDLAPLEREFLDASRMAGTRELDEARARARTETRRSRRLRSALVGIAVLLVVALVAGGLALQASGSADAAALRADANRLAGLASSEPLLKHALLDAVEGVRLHDSAETRAGLLAALQRAPRALRIEQLEEEGPLVSSPGPSVGVLGIPGFGARDAFYDADSLAFRGTLRSDAAIAMLSDTHAATTRFVDLREDDQAPRYELVVRSLGDPSVKDRYPGGSGSVSGLVGSLRSGLLVSAGLRSVPDETGSRPQVHWYVNTWSLDAPGAPPIARHSVPVTVAPNFAPGIAMSPDGQTVYVGRAFGPTLVFDARTLQQRSQLPDIGATDAVALSADGRRIVAISGTALEIVDTQTGERVATVAEPLSSPVNAYTLDATGTALAVGGSDGTLAVWGVEAGAPPSLRLELTGQQDAILGLAFSPDGQDLWSTSLDGSLVRWDVAGTRGVLRRAAPTRSAVPKDAVRQGFALSPDGLQQLAFYAPPVGAYLRDLSTGEVEPFDLGSTEPVPVAAFSPDGASLYAISATGVLHRFDVATRTLTATGPVGARFGQMVVSRRGTVVVATDWGIAQFDATTLAPLPPVRLADTAGLTLRVEVAPDGRSAALLRQRAPLTSDARLLFAEGFGEDSLVLVDLVRGRERGAVSLPDHPFRFEYSPDGSLIVGTTNGRVVLVDPRSRSVTARSAKVADGYVADMLFTDFGIVVSERSGVVSILDSETLRPVGAPLQEVGRRAGSVIALRGRHELLTTYQSGLVTSFDLRPAALLAHACTVAASDLPDRYWRAVLPDREPIAPCG